MNRMMRLIVWAFALMMGVVGGSAVQAETIAVSGGEVSYTGASDVKKLANGDVVLVFTDTATPGTFTLPKNAKARIVAVGGGGAGGSMAAVDQLGEGSAGGGGAGGVSDHETILVPGTYTAQVGTGGARVQTIVQSWVGANGGNSVLLRASQTLLSGKGGGGGGSVKVNGRGEDGGSGGGGSWFGDFTKAGTAVDGQGWAGAVPATTDCGGGGGGAALTATDGVGRADGTPGAGRTLDITGEACEYGRGGAGGQRALGDAAAVDGAGFGWGGAGANVAGRGGAGGDGVVIVRIARLFEYIKVTPPTVATFTWQANTMFTAFNPETVAEPLKSAIDYVEGTLSVTTKDMSREGDTTVYDGVGRYNYAIHLKEEYVWDDGTATGSTSPFVAYWRVTEPGTVDQATVDVTKTVDWSEGNQATIAINIKTKPEKVEDVPNVLVLGSLCNAHELTAQIVRTTLNTITEVANVDYFYFNESTSTASFKGTLTKGQKYEGGVTVKTSNHWTANGFYNQLWALINNGTAEKYDYILFSFDRSRVVGKYTSANAHEKEVADFLAPFYEHGAVIWLVDNLPENCTYRANSKNYTISQTPWYPCDLYPKTSGDTTTWETLSGHMGSSSNGYVAYRGLIGLFAPSMYDQTTKTFWSANNLGTSLDANSPTAVTRLAGPVNPNQVVYDNAANVAAVISDVVKAKPSTITMQDDIYVESGLEMNLAKTGGQWTTNAAVMGWADLTADQLVLTETGVKLALPGIIDPAEIRLTLGVVDTGTFRSSLNAKYNEKTGLWEKDPNNGSVTVSLTPDGGTTILAEAKASTAVAWSFPTYQIKGAVVSADADGNPTGELVINGFITNKLDVAAGCTPEVVFRGKGGYVLDSIKVDGQVVTDFDPDLYNWVFNEVGADHEIEVGFKPVFTTPYPTTGPVTKEYDGAVAQPTVTTPTFIDGYDYEWKAVYALDANGPYATDVGQINVARDANGAVVPTPVYVRIWVNQPGYEEGVVIDYWTGVDNVTITPRAITVKYDDYAQTSNTRKTTDFDHSLVAGSLVAGDTLVEDPGRCTAYPDKGGKTENSITAQNVMTVTTPEFDGCNYTITVLPGDYYYPNLDLVAKATNVNKVYDGVPATTEVTVLFPEAAQTLRLEGDWVDQSTEGFFGLGAKYIRYRVVTNMTLTVSYSVDEGQTYSTENPVYTHVGEHVIMYRVTYEGETHKDVETKERKNGAWQDAGQRDERPISYTPYNGTATITILPRPVTVIAGSAEKEYDGKALAQPQYTVSATTATAGFVNGQGIVTAPMTAESTLTDPGTRVNAIDQTRVVFKSGTQAGDYAITYVEGLLKIEANPLRATALPVTKVYDGEPANNIAVTVVDSHGEPLPAGSYTITYRTSPTGAESATLPDAPTDAGDYPVFYTVNGGRGYGVVSGVATIRVLPRTVTLQAADATKSYDGEPLTSTAFTVVAGEGTGFVGTDGILAVTMTAASTITKPGTTANVINVYDTEHWTMVEGTKAQNYTFTALPGTLTVNRRTVFEVNGDGEFSWTDATGGTVGQTVTVKVDGVPVEVYTTDPLAREHVIHVTDLPGVENDGAVHTIEFVYTDESDPTLYPDAVTWEPAADAEEMYNIVTTDPPTTKVEELKKIVDITNDPESGWLPLYKEDGSMALRSPDGREGDESLTSSFSLDVTGSGEIKVESITIPFTNNDDLGKLTIYVDGKPYVIPPVPDESVSYTIERDGDNLVISNLVIKVTGDSNADHTIDFVYTRTAGADDGSNSAAIVEGIVWKTYGETDDGGTSWLQGKELLIVDHEPLTQGWVYLAFKPTLKVPEEITQWVMRSVNNKKLMVKYGATRALCDACEPVLAALSDKHAITAEKVWVRVKVEELVSAEQDTSVGYWRIYVDASKPVAAEAPSRARLATLQDVSPVPAGEPESEEGAESKNVFGILKIESTAKETMIAVPWTWYSKEENEAQDIPVKKLVKTTNLAVGDYLYCWLPAEGVYRTWIVNEDLEWESSKTVLVDALGNSSATLADDDAQDAAYEHATRVARGGGLWLVRQNPVNADGTAKPFWIYGQSVQTAVTTTINPPTGAQKVCSNMIGNPYARPVRINDLVFGGTVSTSDRIKVPDGTNTPKTLIYVKGKGWRWTKTVLGDDGRVVSVYDYDVTVPAGQAFWYDRRGTTPLTVEW